MQKGRGTIARLNYRYAIKLESFYGNEGVVRSTKLSTAQEDRFEHGDLLSSKVKN